VNGFPRILHRVWLGDRRRPEAYDVYWAEWARMNPEWELITWTEEKLAQLDWPENVRRVWKYLEEHGAHGGIQMDPARAMAVQKADILGYLILANRGGVYVNCDMEPLKPIETWLRQMPPHCNAFAGHEDNHYLCNAVMGAGQDRRFMLAVLGELTEQRVRANPQMEVATGPHLLTQVYYNRGGRGSDLHAFSSLAFYFAHHSEVPYGANASGFKTAALEAGALALHHWGHRTQEGEVPYV
jgi:mannosyltransferase OCH1-like enzyme